MTDECGTRQADADACTNTAPSSSMKCMHEGGDACRDLNGETKVHGGIARAISWSPAGLGPDGGCMLTLVLASGKVRTRAPVQQVRSTGSAEHWCRVQPPNAAMWNPMFSTFVVYILYIWDRLGVFRKPHHQQLQGPLCNVPYLS
jgi:hypothetical protein